MVVQNKGALMILPSGASKGAGLERLLRLCGYSPRNLVAFGDAENDLSLLELGEFGVAVGDAVPTLKAAADLVMTQPGPAGVLEALDTYWLKGHAPTVPVRRERRIPPHASECAKGAADRRPGASAPPEKVAVRHAAETCLAVWSVSRAITIEQPPGGAHPPPLQVF